MANWYGVARSNYVRIKDMDGLREALRMFPIQIHERDGSVCFLSDDEFGGWPSFAYDDPDDDDLIVEFDPSACICPYMEDNQILVMMESGAEKLRYIIGRAEAYNAKGEVCIVRLEDIYATASAVFGVPVDDITAAEY